MNEPPSNQAYDGFESSDDDECMKAPEEDVIADEAEDEGDPINQDARRSARGSLPPDEEESERPPSPALDPAGPVPPEPPDHDHLAEDDPTIRNAVTKPERTASLANFRSKEPQHVYDEIASLSTIVFVSGAPFDKDGK